MKTGGAEGFMMMVGYTDAKNYQWYNVGGWDNVQSNVEQTIGGGKTTIARDKRFRVENNRWYDLQIDVDGDSLHCYIDGKLDFACKLQKGGMMEGVYATTTIDEAKKVMYVKVVNVGEGSADGTLNLKNCQINTAKPGSVTLTQLASESGNDENTLADPKHIYPRQAKAQAQGTNAVKFHVPAFSVNILKIQLK